jgi:glutamate synthase (NADPH/NADH) large chain
MTGGVGVVLGPVGPVLGSGMTGGVVWVHDAERRRVEDRLHKESVRAEAASEAELFELRALVEAHATETQSPLARALLADWANAAARFVKVAPVAAGAGTAQQTAQAGEPVVQLRT